MKPDMNRAAGSMVDIIKTIVRDELAKTDRTLVCVVVSRNERDDTYTLYVDNGLSNGRETTLTNIRNESKRTYSPGDKVYVHVVFGQLAQSFIIGSFGQIGTKDLGRRMEIAEGNVSTLLKRTDNMIIVPTIRIVPFSFTGSYCLNPDASTPTINTVSNKLAFRINIQAPVTPASYTNLYFSSDGTDYYFRFTKSRGVSSNELATRGRLNFSLDSTYVPVKPDGTPYVLAADGAIIGFSFGSLKGTQTITTLFPDIDYSDSEDYAPSLECFGGWGLLDADYEFTIDRTITS